MRKITLAASLLVAPAITQAQASVQAQSQTTVSTSASPAKRATAAQVSSATSSSTSLSGTREHQLSADAQSRIDADLHVARERKLPEEPIRQRVAEGQAKGAGDAQIVAASGRTLVDLQSSFDAMVRGGHRSPGDAEVSRGASLLARGYTSVQLEGVARKAPSDRSLVVAFDALTSLQARGVATTNAVAQIEGQLAARATDAQLLGLATSIGATGGSRGSNTMGSASGTVTAGVAGSTAAGAGAAATGAMGAAASGATTGVSATGGVTGAVSGVLGKP